MPTLLLVEDNEMNRDMLSRRLARKGFTVLLAVDGQQGIDIATEKKPDLVLMDMDLPVVSGWDATRALKAGARYRFHPDHRFDRARFEHRPGEGLGVRLRRI